MVDRLKGNKVVGIKQTTKAIKNGKGDVLYVAKDADDKVINPLIELANNNMVNIVFIETMSQLGKLSGIDVGTAATLILKE